MGKVALGAQQYQRPRYNSGSNSSLHPVKVTRQVRKTVRPTNPKIAKLRQNSGWIVVSILFFAIFYGLIAKIFVIRQVSCFINEPDIACSESLNKNAKELIGTPMLFVNLSKKLEQIYEPKLAFDKVQYYKLLPDILVVKYDFPRPAYQISIGNQAFLGFARDGRYTIAPPQTDVIQIRSSFYPLNDSLADFTIDPVVHQKLLELVYYSDAQRDSWREVKLEGMNQLRIITDKAEYLVDLFNLDEELQKLQFVQQSYSSDTWVEIDLRLSSPVVRTL